MKIKRIILNCLFNKDKDQFFGKHYYFLLIRIGEEKKWKTLR